MRWATASWLIAAACASCATPAPRPTPPPVPRAAERPAAPLPVRNPDDPIYVSDVGFKTPESVIYDARADVYLLSNIDGSPLEADDHAFISRIRPDGEIEALQWIDAADPAVALDAPKGMALVQDTLYVADITFVRKFDRKTGKALGSIKIEGATFVNDVCADQAGNVYVSDSGITVGFTPSGGDAIYKISPDGAVTTLAKAAALGRPNGVVATADGLWIATFGSGELYKLTAGGQRLPGLKPPKGSLDGIVVWKDRLFVSSWEASAIYERERDGFVERVSALPAPSDIGFDDKRSRLLIPLFYDNTLVIYPL